MHTETAVWRQSRSQVQTVESSKRQNLSVEQVQNWLAREDSATALLVGYGLCGVTLFYLLICILRGLLGRIA